MLECAASRPWDYSQPTALDLLPALFILKVGGERPPLDQAWPKGFQELLKDCWKRDPSLRPDIVQVRVRCVNLWRILTAFAMGRDEVRGGGLKTGNVITLVTTSNERQKYR